MSHNHGTIRKILLASIITLIACFAVFTMYADKREVKAGINPMMNFIGKVTDSNSDAVDDDVYDFSFGLYTTATSGTAIWSESLFASTTFTGVITEATVGSSTITYAFTGATSTALRAGQYLTNASTSEYALITDYSISGATSTVTILDTTVWSVSEGINNRPRTEGGVVDIDIGSVSDLSAINFNQVLYLEVVFNGETMQPRKLITSAEQAFNADKLDNRSEEEFGALADDETITGEWDFLNIVDIATSSASTALTVTQSGAGDIINLFAGSEEIFTVLSSGYVGIGTTSPSVLLTIGSSTPTHISGYRDTFLSGNFEVDGISYFDGTTNLSNASTTQLTISDYLWIGDDDTDNLDIRAGVWQFTSTATTTVAMADGINFDSNTFVVDPHSNRIGILTNTPAYGLDINGTLRSVGAVFFDSTLSVAGNAVFDSNITLGSATTSDVTYFNSRIGTHLIPTVDNVSDLGGETDWLRWRKGLFGTSVGIEGTATSTGSELKSSGAYLIDSSGTLSINTTNNYPVTFGTGLVTIPNATLTSASTTQLTISDYLWIGDDDTDNLDIRAGVWQFTSTATTTINMANGINFDSNTFVIDPHSDRIGILTNTPAYGLDINGTLRSVGAVFFDATLSVAGNAVFDSNITLGSATTSDVTYFNSRIGTHLIPTVDNVSDLGGETDWLRWRTGYFGTSVGIEGTATSTGSQLKSSGAYLIDASGTLSINTANNYPVTFGTGLVTIPNATLTSASTTQLTISDYLWIGDDDTDNLDIRAGVWQFTSTATTTVAMADGINFDSNTFVVDPHSDRIGILTNTPAYGLDINGTLRSVGAVFFDATLSVAGNAVFDSNITLGSATTSDVTYFNSRIGTHLIPTVDNVSDLGGETDWLRWRTGYFGTSVGIEGTATSTGSQLKSSGAYLIDSSGTLSINTANNYPVTFGTGLVTIPNVTLTSASTTQLTISDYLWIGDDDTDNLDIRAGVWDLTSTATTTVDMANGINFDSNTFVIDSHSDRIGILTNTPAYGLDINGTLRSVGAVFFDSTLSVAGNAVFDSNITLGSATTSDVTYFNSRIGTHLIPTVDNVSDLGGETDWLRWRKGLFGTSVGIEGTATSTGSELKSSGAYLIDASGTLSINTTNNYPVTFGTGLVTIPNATLTSASTTQLTISDYLWIGDDDTDNLDIRAGVWQFTSTATTTVDMINGINFDSNTFVIDPHSDRIGILTDTPSYGLDVNGIFRTTGATFLNSTLNTAGNATFDSNVDLGNATTSDVTYFNSRIGTHLIPTVDNVSDLGDETDWLRWRTGYFGTSVGIAGTATSTGIDLKSSGNYLIDSAGTLSINTTNNQAITFGTGNITAPYASSTAITVVSLYPTDIHAFTLQGAITANNQNITGINTASTTDLVVSNDTTLSKLTASRLLSLDASNKIINTDLNSWMAGTANQIIIADDGDGTITLSAPQNIHTSATPTFASTTLSNFSTGSIPFFTSGGSMFQDNANLFWDDANNRLGIGTSSPSVSFAIDSTDAIVIPVGTDAQRPASAYTGMLRYNTNSSQFEGYGNSNWTGLGGVIDVDQDTYILAESAPGEDEDVLFFYTNGSERARFTSAGNFGIGTTSPDVLLAVGSSTPTHVSGYRDSFMAGDLEVDGTTYLDGALNVAGITTFSGNLMPGADITYDIGSQAYRWNNINAGGVIDIWTRNNSSWEKASMSFKDDVASDVFTIETTASTTGQVRDIQIKTGANNGIYLNSSGYVGIGYTNPSDALVVDGLVGIGTSDPTSHLDVLANGRATGDIKYGLRIVNTDKASSQATRIGLIGNDTNTWIIGTDYNADNSNNFYIGTTTPDATPPFGITSDGNIYIGNTVVPGDPANKLYSDGGALFWNSVELTGGVTNYWNRTSPYMYLNTITDNIGIGTTTPDSKLTVIGKIHASSTSEQLRLSYDVAGDKYASFTIDSSGDLTIDLATTNATTTFSDNVEITGNLGGSSPLSIVTGVNITGGNVGIGTSSPLALLSLQGTAGSSDIFTIASSTGANLLTVTKAGNIDIVSHNGSTAGLKLGGTLVTATAAEINTIKPASMNILLNAFRIAINGSLVKFNMVDGIMDEFEDESGVDTGASTGENYDATGDYYRNISIVESYTAEVFDYSNSGMANYTLRSVLAAADISTSGSKIRITVEAHHLNQTDFDNFAIVERNGSTANGTTIPTEILFSGGSGVSIAAGEKETSDWLEYELDETKDYLVISDTGAANGNPRQKASTGNHTYYEAGAGYNQQNMTSPVDYNNIDSIVVNLEIQNVGDMSLVSNSTEAEANPDTVRIVLMEEDVDTATLNTDIKAYASRDNGGNWVQATLTDEGDYGSGKRILTGEADVSGQASDKTVKWKVTTHNSKELKLHGLGYVMSLSGGADIAEWFKVGTASLDAELKSTLEPADIVCVDPNAANKVVRCSNPQYNTILGIVSTDPYLTMGAAYQGPDANRIAMVGQVPVKVTLESGEIKPGDRISLSRFMEGTGKKAAGTEQFVGIALEEFNYNSDYDYVTSSAEAVNLCDTQYICDAKFVTQANQEQIRVKRILVFINLGQSHLAIQDSSSQLIAPYQGLDSIQSDYYSITAPAIFIDSLGNVGINDTTPTYKLDVNGTIRGFTITDSSDERWKKNIVNLDNTLNKLSQLRGVYYDWRVDEYPELDLSTSTQIGIIAQELETQYPELVNTDIDGYKSIQYGKFSAVLLEGIKELNTKVDLITGTSTDFSNLSLYGTTTVSNLVISNNLCFGGDCKTSWSDIVYSGDTSNWDTAYGWGDHSAAGYLVSASSTNWDLAHSWGDHSLANYFDKDIDTINTLTVSVKGDILIASADNNITPLAIGNEGYVLSSVSGLPQWVATSTLGFIGGTSTTTNNYYADYYSYATTTEEYITSVSTSTVLSMVDDSLNFLQTQIDDLGAGISVDLSQTGNITPASDNAYNIGSPTNKYANIYAQNLVAGDLVFTETTSAVSGDTFQVGDVLSLYVTSTGADTHTVPIDFRTAINTANYGSGNIHFDTTGNMGLGFASSTAPEGKLHIYTSKTTGDFRLLTLQNYQGDGNISYQMSINHTDGNLQFTSNDNSQGSLINAAYSAWNMTVGGAGDYWGIKRSPTGSLAYADLLRITSAGNIGIGTSSPLALLSLQGTAGSSDIFTIASSTGANLLTVTKTGNVGIGTTSPAQLLSVEGMIYSGTGGFILPDGTIVDDSGDLGKWTTSGSDIYYTLGNVGIGTTSPMSKLSITANSGAQLTLAYNNSNYANFTVDGSSNLSIEPANSGTTSLGTGDESMRIDSNGNVGIGTTSPDSLLDIWKSAPNATDIMFKIASSTGIALKIQADGTTYADGSYVNTGADYAEYYYSINTDLEAGEVVCVDITRDNAVERCERAADSNVMGIVSSKPAIVGNNKDGYENNPNYKIIGMLGQVPAKVSAENGDIRPGDSLTSASIPGYLMKANAGDPTVGVALEGLEEAKLPIGSLASGSSTGIINVLISRRNKSLTVETVEEQITDRIAAMEIEDEVNILIANAVNALDIDDEINSNLDPKLLFLESKLTVRADDLSGRMLNAENSIQTLISSVVKLDNDVANFEFKILNFEIILNDRISKIENNFVIDNEGSIRLGNAEETEFPAGNSVSIVEIVTSTTTEKTAFVVNQSGSGDIADFQANEVSIMNIADSGKVSIVGELMVDGRIMACSGGSCGQALDEAVDETMGDIGVEGTIVAGAYSGYCDEGYAWVPGSAKYGTMPGFCVMENKATGEAELPAGSLASDADSIWTNISQGEAQFACQSLGEKYHLISENEWLTIAENIIRVAANDIDETKDGLQLATTTIATTSEFILSNGNVIYNLSGATAEWTDQTTTKAGCPVLAGTDEWQEYYNITDYKGINIAPAYYLSDIDNNIGKIKIGNSDGNLRGFVRGSNGIYGINLSNSPTTATSTIGFRCAK